MEPIGGADTKELTWPLLRMRSHAGRLNGRFAGESGSAGHIRARLSVYKVRRKPAAQPSMVGGVADRPVASRTAGGRVTAGDAPVERPSKTLVMAARAHSCPPRPDQGALCSN